MADTDDFENQDSGDDKGTEDNGAQDGDKKDSGAAESGKSSEDTQSGDDLRKMQSERDKETARANKAQKEVDKMKAASAKSAGSTEVPPQVQEWINAAQSRTREALYEANPKFKTFGIDPTLISGDTPAEMTASAKTLTEFVDTLETTVRDEVLKEHGFDPSPKASASIGRKDFNKMDTKEFDAIVEEALRG